MTDWKEKTLAEVADITPGFAFKSKQFGTVGDVVIKIKDISPPNVDLSNAERVDLSLFYSGRLNKYRLQRGDYVVAMTGATIGKVGRMKSSGHAYINQRVARIGAKEGVSNEFIYFSITTDAFQSFIQNNIDSNSAQENISGTSLGRFSILLPPLLEQTAIAEVLSSLDDKIDLLHRQNKTLEQLAETMFRQWFVEGAEEGWEIKTLGEEFDFTMGQSPAGEDLNEDKQGIVFYQGRTDFGFRFPSPRVYTTAPSRVANPLDTLVSVRAPVGDMNMAFEKCCLGRGVAAFHFRRHPAFHSYTYYKLRSLMQDIQQFEDNGSVFGSIGKDDFGNLENAIPPPPLVEKFQNRAKPIDDKILLNTTQIGILTNLRDTLLPKLMSGEIRANLK